MFLKQIELIGFKSFADRVRLEFGEGVSAIIGPNGSGKSNISDAMKWVLGEQSVKSLRGSSMEDVIFNGTSTRKSLGRASVSITISNERGILPIAFKEVTVTRRIFRTGDSQYLINDSECRLKDVIELFMDTGLSKGSYSIISQGQIGTILTSNPYDRRTIFEEAAGIVKYKTRKKIALNKLDATKQDLLRVSDILLELERQIRSLKYQAAKAERYKVLSEQLETTEIYARYVEYEKNFLEIAELKKEHILNSDKKIEIEAKISAHGSDYETGKLRLMELDGEINRISEKIFVLNENIKNNEYKILDNNSKINNYDFQIKQYG
ncbi:AAA family ATPase, partial [Candidatus Dependentiae bacterium]|nr:AAA family ATPase [Candidatus Dependentiae bacterium]